MIFLITILAISTIWLVVRDESTLSGNSTSNIVSETADVSASQRSTIQPHETVTPSAPLNTLNHKAHIADLIESVQTYLSSGQTNRAVQLINQRYSGLSSSDLEMLKQLFHWQADKYASANSYSNMKRLYAEMTPLFDEVDVWDGLYRSAALDGDWQVAVEALMRSSSLEHRPVELDTKLVELVRASSYLRAQLESSGNELEIQNLYSRLHNQHPAYPRFQLALAQSYLRSGQDSLAEVLLQGLVYDPQLGLIAEQQLARISAGSSSVQNPTAPEETSSQSDIVIPLRRLGHSFVASASVNGKSLNMLLDTGASITALSSDTINRLGLEPTGQSVTLNTANGTLTSNLYNAERIQIGRLMIRNLVVAEIDLRGSTDFQGLLGTDLLNQAKGGYGYLIDNQRNALIFRRN